MATNKTVTVTTIPTRTGDTVASYNVYSDNPSAGTFIGVMTPGEAAAGKVFSLADVLHNITVKTVWTTAGESTTNVSNIVVVDLSVTDWTISGAAYDSKAADVSTETTQTRGVWFKPDGTKFYIVENIADDLLEYDLSTAWDVSTASYLKLHNILGGIPLCLQVSPDGLNMLYLNTSLTAVYSKTLATPWEFTTGIGANKVFDLTTITGVSPAAIFASPDGLNLWYTGGNHIYKFSFGTAWDANTLTYDSVSFDLSAQQGAALIRTPFFSDTGKKLFVLMEDNANAGANTKVYEYNLSVAFDISTITYSGNSFSVASEETQPMDLYIKPDGTKFYTTGMISREVIQYSMG